MHFGKETIERHESVHRYSLAHFAEGLIQSRVLRKNGMMPSFVAVDGDDDNRRDFQPSEFFCKYPINRSVHHCRRNAITGIDRRHFATFSRRFLFPNSRSKPGSKWKATALNFFVYFPHLTVRPVSRIRRETRHGLKKLSNFFSSKSFLGPVFLALDKSGKGVKSKGKECGAVRNGFIRSQKLRC